METVIADGYRGEVRLPRRKDQPTDRLRPGHPEEPALAAFWDAIARLPEPDRTRLTALADRLATIAARSQQPHLVEAYLDALARLPEPDRTRLTALADGLARIAARAHGSPWGADVPAPAPARTPLRLVGGRAASPSTVDTFLDRLARMPQPEPARLTALADGLARIAARAHGSPWGADVPAPAPARTPLRLVGGRAASPSTVDTFLDRLRRIPQPEPARVTALADHLAVIATETQTAAEPVAGRTRRAAPARSWRRRTVFSSLISSLVSKVAFAGMALAASTGGLAAAGALPDPAQQVISDLAGRVGISVPAPPHAAAPPEAPVALPPTSSLPASRGDSGTVTVDDGDPAPLVEGLEAPTLPDEAADTARDVLDIVFTADPSEDGPGLGEQVSDAASGDRSGGAQSGPPADLPANPPAGPPTTPPAGPPANPPAGPPAGPPATPPANPPANPPAGPPATPPANPPAGPPAGAPADTGSGPKFDDKPGGGPPTTPPGKPGG